MKKIKGNSVLLLLICFLLLIGCSKEKDASTNNNKTLNQETPPSSPIKDDIEISELLAEANIAVVEGGESLTGDRVSWSIEQVDQLEVIGTNTLEQAPAGELSYTIWYGQNDLATLKVQDGGESEITSTKLKKVLSDNGSRKATVEEIIEGIDYLSSKENTSYRTIKVMSYAFVSEGFDSVPFSYFNEIINQVSESKITLDKEDNKWVARGDSDLSPKTQLIRTRSSVQIFDGQGIKEFDGIETPAITSSKSDEGKAVLKNLRRLVWDVDRVLTDQEPKYFPDYAKALVESYQSEEDATIDFLRKELEKYSTATISRDYLSSLKWGMKVNELKQLLPNAKEESADNGGVSLSLEENRYAQTSCVEGDTVFFNFVNEGLESISYNLIMNPKCNMDDPKEKDLVKKGYQELYDQVISEYDPTHKNGPNNLYHNQEWENETSKFTLAFWVALDYNPPAPYAEYTITKNKDGAPVVLNEEYLNQKPTQGNQTSETSSKDWTGEWSENDAHSGQFLEITKQVTGGFDFVLNVTNGGNTGMLEGNASYTSENKAVYPPDEVGCEITFVHKDDHIEVTENDACSGYKGAGVGSFNGKYPKGGVTNTVTFTSIGMLPENIDSTMKTLTGEDYDRFVERFGTYTNEEDLDGFGANVYYGFVRGVATSLNGVVMYKETGEIWAAYLDGSSLIYYTNVEGDEETLPETIKTHYEDHADLTVEYMAKG